MATKVLRMILGPTDFHSTDKNMEVNDTQNGFEPKHSSKYILCDAQKKGMHADLQRVNDFWVSCPFNCVKFPNNFTIHCVQIGCATILMYCLTCNSIVLI